LKVFVLYLDLIIMQIKFLPIILIMILVTKMGFADDIYCFTDSQGILHISNVRTTGVPEPAKLHECGIPGSPGGELSISPALCGPPLKRERSGLVLISAKGGLPEGEGQSQSHSVEKSREEVYEAAKSLGGGTTVAEKHRWRAEKTGSQHLAHPLVSGSILSDKDPRGVIHIYNRTERQVKTSIQVATGPPPREKLPPWVVHLPAIQPVAWPAPVAPAAVSGTPAPVVSSYPGKTICHYRDQRGVWRITNNPRSEEDSPPAPPLVCNAGGPKWLDFGIEVGPQALLARRDWQGICHIFNHAAELVRDQGSPMSFLGKIPHGLESIIIDAARMYRLPVPLILALIRNESNFVSQAVSPKGAMGLMQLMPGTAQLLGVQDPFSPKENIQGGCRYLRYLLDYFQGSVPLALAAYNAGSQRVISAGYRVPHIKETQGFVTNVMALYYLLEKLAV
jgi:hypothetical protein